MTIENRNALFENSRIKLLKQQKKEKTRQAINEVKKKKKSKEKWIKNKKCCNTDHIKNIENRWSTEKKIVDLPYYPFRYAEEEDICMSDSCNIS